MHHVRPWIRQTRPLCRDGCVLPVSFVTSPDLGVEAIVLTLTHGAATLPDQIMPLIHVPNPNYLKFAVVE